MNSPAKLLRTEPQGSTSDSTDNDQLFVLIIDDDLSVRLMARQCLEKSGFRVVEASCALEGLELFEALCPDVILCDVVMPDHDGYYVCEQIRASEQGAHLPIIMLTGLDDLNSIERAYAAGATEFSVKPINVSLLPRSVRFIVRASQALEQFKRSEERYALAARGANDGLWDWDIKTGTVYYSDRWREILGPDIEIGDTLESWLQQISAADADRVRAELNAHLEGQTRHFESEFRILCSGGNYRWVRSRGMATRDEAGKPARMAGSMTDISVQKAAEEQLVQDALHDSLTRLPNRNLFLDRLRHTIDVAGRRGGSNFAVMFLDLDRFKVINDSMGHHIGDLMLVEIADRIRSTMRRADTLARFGGDEFTILLEDVSDITVATNLAERLQLIIAEPIDLDGHQVVTSASIGITMGSDHYNQPEDMLRDADVAMYRAKALGKGSVEVFDTTMRMHAVYALRTESELRTALANKQFVANYQPIYNLASGELTGFEALVRWDHPKYGLVRPDEFLQIAEDSGLIVRLGREMLETACKQLVSWREAIPEASNWTVSVNISSQELEKSDLLGTVDGVLRDLDLPAHCLKLEITERSLIENDERAVSVLKDLHERGVKLAIDDFGTGYSSLSYLHRFPFDELKVDRSFIRDVERESRQAGLVKAIIQLGRNLDLSVTAEGVETEASIELLKSLNCDRAQGYFLSRPISADQLPKLIDLE